MSLFFYKWELERFFFRNRKIRFQISSLNNNTVSAYTESKYDSKEGSESIVVVCMGKHKTGQNEDENM